MLHHLKAVWSFRYFWMSLVRGDLRSRYRRSFLGIGWSALHPIAMSGAFCLVFSSIMTVNGGAWVKAGYAADWQGYGAYMVAGLVVWGVIRDSTTAGCHALLQNEAYIRQCPLPYGIYPLRTVMGIFIHFLISMVVVVVLVTLLRGSLDAVGILWAVLPAFVLLFLFCWSLATLAAFATPYFPDTSHLVEVGSQLFFFLTPLMYTTDLMKEKGIAFLADLNPVVPFLELIRNPLVTGHPPHPYFYLQGVALTAAFLGLAFGTIAWLQKKVIFQL